MKMTQEEIREVQAEVEEGGLYTAKELLVKREMEQYGFSPTLEAEEAEVQAEIEAFEAEQEAIRLYDYDKAAEWEDMNRQETYANYLDL